MPIQTPEERVGALVAGKYRLERIVATGGMATVYAGTHEWTHRDVAVKILHYEHARDSDVVKRFLQEARACARLKHPNVVDVLDMGQERDGTVYLVLELLQGETLKQRIKRGPIASHEILPILGPILEAICVAHALGVVHRDLKPDNIFLALGGDRVIPKLLDFGIAKVHGADSSETRTGVMIGTPQYMAPEQVRGQRDVGPAADVWSIGVVLYEILAGRVPFRGDSPAVVIAKVLTERPVPLRYLTTAPLDVIAVVERAMQPEPAGRHADTAAMLGALHAAFERWSASGWAMRDAEALPDEKTIATPSGEVPFHDDVTEAPALSDVATVAGPVNHAGPPAPPGRIETVELELEDDVEIEEIPALPAVLPQSATTPTGGARAAWMWLAIAGVGAVSLVTGASVVYVMSSDGAEAAPRETAAPSRIEVPDPAPPEPPPVAPTEPAPIAPTEPVPVASVPQPRPSPGPAGARAGERDPPSGRRPVERTRPAPSQPPTPPVAERASPRPSRRTAQPAEPRRGREPSRGTRGALILR